MFKWPRFEVLSTSRRDFALVFTLLFNAFTWSYMVIVIMQSISLHATLESAFNTIYYISAAGAGLAGALFSEKIRRSHFLNLWMFLGFFSSSLLIFMYSITIAHLSIIFILLGVSFGLGMPSSLAYLGDYTNVKNRGLISSLIFLTANLSVLPLAILFMALEPVVSSIILTVWRGFGLIVFAVLKPKEENIRERKKRISFFSVFGLKAFSLYLLPWVMFTLIDAFEKPLLKDFFGLEFHRFIITVEPIIAVSFMLIGGLLADRIGRKRVIIYGFISLGVAYAIVGLAPMMMAAWYLYVIVDGAAWGILLTAFLLIIWGDLSEPGDREKFYALGNFPFLVRSTVSLLFITVVASVPASAAFSLASFFLFLAVLPLMYAPETLPEKDIELRRQKEYVKEAKKLRDKYQS